MQSRNTSLVLLFCLSLALTIKEAQQIPVKDFELNWSHSKKIDIDSFFANSKKWHDATKGQLISKCPFGVVVSTKIPTKKFDNFCPRI